MSTAPPSSAIEPVQHYVVPHVSWEGYVHMLDGLGTRPGTRTAYDGSTLELMTTSRLHEIWKKRLGRFLEAITVEMGLPIEFGGSMTFRREDLAKGLEPDQCYWIEHAADVVDREELDFTVDPPPDLCIEIEVSRTVVDRLGIYAALGVPEVWRFDGRAIEVLLLDEGAYAVSQESRQLNGFPIRELDQWLDSTEKLDENARFARFNEWLREWSERGE
jgi:Uma2 family endonuclease